MNFSIIPWWWKALAAAALLAGLWMAFAWWRAGVVQEGWDARDLTAKAEIAKMQIAIEKQNEAVAALGEAKTAADERRSTAEKFASDAIKTMDKRAARVATSTATSCDGVMREAWGAWK